MDAILIAVDGPAGSGKSTLAHGLARALGLPYVNTGLMYRALAAAAIRERVSPDEADVLLELARGLRFRLGGEEPVHLEVEGYSPDELTTPDVESSVSAVSRHRAVRRWMCERQRSFGRAGAVMEGRDIGSVVFPYARLKLFLRAEVGERATRREAERSFGVVAPIDARDARDALTTPLEPTPDAVVLDTGRLGIDATLAEALRLVAERWPDVVR
jgi:cytidylate kinase